MSDELRPMLNTPAENGIAAAEEFAEDKIGRMDGAHDARVKLQGMTAEDPKAQMERIEKWKQGVIARFSELTGLEFDQNGKCITPGRIRMDGDFKQKWAQMVEEFSAQKDPQKAEQLFGEAGRLLRGAAEKP